LVAATEAWSSDETTRLKAEVALLKKLQKGRGGADGLRSTMNTQATQLLNNQIDDFFS
jgi:hypothetical protein